MSSDRRFEQELPSRLDDLYVGSMPAYRDYVLEQTARTRQRPAWSFVGRWLPMVDIARQHVLVPRLAWRAIGLGFVLLALLVALAAALVVGARPNLPKPFGLARPGLVAYASGGHVHTIDPVTGRATPVATGVDSASDPVWSRDGTMLAFKRGLAPDLLKNDQIMVAAADGSGPHAVTRALPNIGMYSFSPDGRQIVFTSGDGTSSALWIADVQQGLARQLDVHMDVAGPSWLPPDGAEIVFAGSVGDQPSGLYAVDPASGKVRTIVEPKGSVGAEVPDVSPDGSRVAYSAIDHAVQDRNSYQVHVVDIDGTNDHVLPIPSGATFQDRPTWSNDGTRLVIVRGFATRNQAVALAIVPADGSGVGVETTHDITGCCDNAMEWAPDDSSILFLPEDQSGNATTQLLIDPSTGKATPAAWGATSLPAWQRRAP